MSFSTFMQDREYIMHRKRMSRAESSIAKSIRDTHRSSSDLSARGGHRTVLKERMIYRANESLHHRLVRVQQGESLLRNEQDHFTKKFATDRQVLLRNKVLSKVHKAVVLEEENMRMYQRIQKAPTLYSAAACRHWYDHQLKIKPAFPPMRDRHCPPDLRPAPMPKTLSIIADSDNLSRSRSELRSLSRLSQNRRSVNSLAGSQTSSIVTELPFNWQTSLDAEALQASYVSYLPPQMMLLPPMERIKSRRRRRIKSRRESVTEEEQPVPPKDVSDDSYVDDTELPAAAGSLSRAHSSDFTYMEDSSEGISSICGCKASDLHKVIGWEFAIPNDTRNCVVHVFVSRDVHDDYVYMTVVTANPPYKKLSEKRVTIDELFDVVETVRNIDQMAEEDASSLRILLRNIFVEADEDHSGHLSFSELQVLLDKINLGLSSADLRSIVAEADVDESGFVDYEEFVPIAIDMVLGYRARARANVHHIDAAVADLIHQSISVEEVERIDAYCMTQFKLSDPLNNGVISFNLFKSRLNRAVGIGLSPNDVRLLCQNIPRDYRGRCLYLSFKEVLYDVRFMSANNAIIEDQGSDLQRHIIDLCLQEERRLADQVCSDPDDFSDTVLKGQIPLRSMVDILLTSPLLSLNRLQVMLLTSEANVVKGKVSIYQFVPACVKTIEMMFDPQALRVRAELLADEDLSVESLLDGEKQEDFDRRLALLFKSNDLDGSGGLDAHEFSSCMASLNLGITDNEIESLYSLATSTATVASQLNYDEFAAFVSRNLLDLVREKRIRAIEISKKERTSRASVVRRVGEKLDVLLAVYMEASTGGYVAFDSVAEALQQSGLGLSPTLLEVMLCEVCPVGRGENPVVLAATHSHIIEGFTSRGFDENQESFEGEVARHMVHRMFFLNAGVSFDLIHKALRKADTASKQAEGDDDTPLHLSKRYKSALESCHLQRCELNFMLRRMFPPGRPDDHVTSAPGASDLKSMWCEAHKLTLLRGLCDFQRQIELFELTSAELQKEMQDLELHELQEQDATYGPTDSVGISLRTCVSVLEGLSALRFGRREVLHTLFMFDSYEVSMKVTKYKRLAKTASDIAVLMRSKEYLQRNAALLDALEGAANSNMRGLTREALREWLENNLPFDDSLAERALPKVLASVPQMNLGDREVVVLVATLPAGANGCISRRDIIELLYDHIALVRWARTYARHLTIKRPPVNATEDAISSHNMVLRRLAERLLNSVKLENWNGNVRITFPDMRLPLLRDDDDQVGPDLGEETSRSKAYSRTLTIEGEDPTSSASARISTTIGTSVRSLSEASTLTIVAMVDGLPNLSLVYAGVPSLAVIDEETADEFVDSVLASVYIRAERSDKGELTHQLSMRRSTVR